MKEDSAAPIRAHVFSNVNAPLFLKHFPNRSPILEGIEFSFGLEIPEHYDVLVVYNRASYSLETTLPKSRLAFIAAEPDVIHPFKRSFLNQFGIVVTGTNKELQTEKWKTSPCFMWFAGIDFSKPFKDEYLIDSDWFRALPPPKKKKKISIVTSTKNFTNYHKKRLDFISALQRIIPNDLVLFGRGHHSIDDKKDALLPYAYHLAIENGDGDDLWTEKLADPYLCWAFPLYAGCSNAADYFPAESFHFVDLDDPEGSAKRMISLLESDHYERALESIKEARQRVLDTHNSAGLLVRLVKACMQKPTVPGDFRRRKIWSERSLWPEAGSRGGYLEWAVRNTAMLFFPDIELRGSRVQAAFERSRAKRRKAKTLRDEARRGGAN